MNKILSSLAVSALLFHASATAAGPGSPPAPDLDARPERERVAGGPGGGGIEIPPEVAQPSGIPWAKGLSEAREASTKTGKPLLIDFGAEWCGFCKKLDRETFGNEAVIRLVRESFVPVRVDADKEPEVVASYKVSGLPTVVFVAPSGAELQRIEGFCVPEEFLKTAGKAAESSASFTKIKELAEKDPGDIEAQRAYGRALFAAGKAEEATQLLRKALEGIADRPAIRAGILIDLADAQRLRGKSAEARDAYREVLAMGQDAAREERKRVLLPLARVLISLKDTAGAVPVLDEFLADDAAPAQERLEALFLRGYAYAARKDADKALADLKEARRVDPEGRWGLRAAMIIEAVESR